jgi:hypothetical protein
MHCSSFVKQLCNRGSTVIVVRSNAGNEAGLAINEPVDDELIFDEALDQGNGEFTSNALK